MVPGSLGCGLAVFAAITMLAPSLAAFSAIAFPIPRLPPVTNNVRPFNSLNNKEKYDLPRVECHYNVLNAL